MCPSVTLQVLANGDANSPAMERMTQLVQECLALSAGMAVANPKGTFAFHSLKMDAASPSSPEEAPSPDFWARIVVSLALCSACTDAFVCLFHNADSIINNTTCQTCSS